MMLLGIMLLGCGFESRPCHMSCASIIETILVNVLSNAIFEQMKEDSHMDAQRLAVLCTLMLITLPLATGWSNGKDVAWD